MNGVSDAAEIESAFRCNLDASFLLATAQWQEHFKYCLEELHEGFDYIHQPFIAEELLAQMEITTGNYLCKMIREAGLSMYSRSGEAGTPATELMPVLHGAYIFLGGAKYLIDILLATTAGLKSACVRSIAHVSTRVLEDTIES